MWQIDSFFELVISTPEKSGLSPNILTNVSRSPFRLGFHGLIVQTLNFDFKERYSILPQFKLPHRFSLSPLRRATEDNTSRYRGYKTHTTGRYHAHISPTSSICSTSAMRLNMLWMIFDADVGSHAFDDVRIFETTPDVVTTAHKCDKSCVVWAADLYNVLHQWHNTSGLSTTLYVTQQRTIVLRTAVQLRSASSFLLGYSSRDFSNIFALFTRRPTQFGERHRALVTTMSNATRNSCSKLMCVPLLNRWWGRSGRLQASDKNHLRSFQMYIFHHQNWTGERINTLFPATSRIAKEQIHWTTRHGTHPIAAASVSLAR